ncbi:hypothetical protein D3C85_1472140 [compost metagenome]
MLLVRSTSAWAIWSADGRTCTVSRVTMAGAACTDEANAEPAARAMAMASVLVFMARSCLVLVRSGVVVR